MKLLFVLVGLLLGVGQALAETSSTRITRAKMSDPLYAFTVKVESVKERDEVILQVQVTVKAKQADGHVAMPYRAGNLELHDGKKFLSACELRPTLRGETRSYAFRVNAAYAERSTFTFAETMGGPDDGDYFYQGMFYWFYLKDFVETK